MTPEFSDFIPSSLEDMDTYIEVIDVYHVTEKQKGQVRIKICDNNGDPFIATLHNVFLVQYLCDRLFSIITLMNSGYTCLFKKVFCTLYFGDKEKKAMTKVVTNLMTIRLCHHYLAKKKRMQWILAMLQMMNLCLRRC